MKIKYSNKKWISLLEFVIRRSRLIVDTRVVFNNDEIITAVISLNENKLYILYKVI